MIRAIVLTFALTLLPAHALAGEPACESTMISARGTDASITCFCDANAMTNGASASIWGTDLYTDDSSICGAALHAGMLDKAGGTVTVKPAKGCKSYTGLKRNSITTQDYGEWQGSFYFPETGQHVCDEETTVGDSAIQACPSSAGDRRGETTPLVCICKPEQVTGNVWGVDTYTDDSSICAAAVHAGVIAPTGGIVTINGLHGCESYDGLARNGITSKSYGKWKWSYFFPIAGAGNCPQPP